MGTKVYELRIDGLIRLSEASKPVQIDPTKCLATTSGLAKLEPPPGERMFGFHLDWSKQRPSDIRDILGRNPTVINAFLLLDHTQTKFLDFDMLRWHAQEVQKINGILALTIEPVEIDTIPAYMLEQIAQEIRKINEKGVPMFLRYGHEMNSYWTDYGMQPISYISGYRKMSAIIKQYTNMTAMVWGPNVGVDYPFGYEKYATQSFLNRVKEPSNFALLDTNNDKTIDEEDDPYTPYYPGDAYVDWFALSLYYYPSEKSLFNQAVDPNAFTYQLVGNSLSKRPIYDNFYAQFPQKHRKPMMIPETGSPYFPNSPKGLPEVQLKEPWWQQLYSEDTFARFPNLKLVVHFEEMKKDYLHDMRDWRVLNDPATRSAFIQDLNSLGKKLLTAQDIEYSCDGSITLKAP